MELYFTIKICVTILLHIFNYGLVITETVLDGRYLKTCPRPLAPSNAVVSYLAAPRFYLGKKSNGRYSVSEYQEHDKVYFQCKDGFSQAQHTIMYITCGSNGKWFPEPENSGKCIPNENFHKCTTGLFQCASSKKCISVFKRCDCVRDCDDGSDEDNCDVRRKYIMATSYGRDSAGIISSPGYPRLYPKHFSCTYYVYTLKGHRIQLDFEEFQLPDKVENKCIDRVSLVGLHPWYLSKDHKNYKKIRKSQKLSDFTETRCGDNKFKRVFSNLTHLTINVSLGYLGSDTNYRGFSLSWKVKSSTYVNDLLSKMSENMNDLKTTKNETGKEGFYTVLTPITISALLPLSLITFLCCHRRLRRRNANVKKKQKTTETDDGKDSKPMTLTENNLAQFDYQMRHSSNEQFTTYPRNLISGSSNHIIAKDNSLIEHRYHSTCNATIDTAEQNIKRDSNSSGLSEPNRYIMSYDLPLKHSPMSSVWHERPLSLHSNSRITHNINNISSRQLHSHHNNSPHLIHAVPHRCRHARCSRNLSKSQNVRNSYSSQSNSSSNLRHLKKLNNMNYDQHLYPVNSEYNDNTLGNENNKRIYPVESEYHEKLTPANEDYVKKMSPPENGLDTHQLNNYKKINSIDTKKINSIDTKNGYHNNTQPVIRRSVEAYLDCDNSSSSIEKQDFKKKIRCSKKQCAQNMWPYPDRRPTHDIYTPRSFSSTDRTLGGSLICTH